MAAANETARLILLYHSQSDLLEPADMDALLLRLVFIHVLCPPEVHGHGGVIRLHRDVVPNTDLQKHQSATCLTTSHQNSAKIVSGELGKPDIAVITKINMCRVRTTRY